MSTLLITQSDYWKSEREPPKSKFPTYIIEVFIKSVLIYVGVTLFAFIYLRHLFSKPFPWGWEWGWGMRGNPEYLRNLWEKYYHYKWYDFFQFLWDYSTGNWMESLVIADGVPAFELIMVKFPTTVELLIYTSVLVVVCSYFIGFFITKVKWSRSFRFLDRFFRILIGFFTYVPVMGIFLQYKLAIELDIFPTIGIKTPGFEDPIRITGGRLFDSFITGRFDLFKDTLWHLVLPLFTLISYGIAIIYKRVRKRFLYVFNQEYTKTALMKGSKISMRSHLIRSMGFPMMLSDLRIILPSLLSMVMIVEHAFNLKGSGMLFIDAVNLRDPGVVLGLIWCLTVLMLYLNMDLLLLQYLIDPRYNPRQNFDIPNISRVS